MKTKPLVIIALLSLFLHLSMQAQISHGGEPLFLQNSFLRSTPSFYVEMPSFDAKKMLEEDKLDETNTRGSFRFAKKFYVDVERGKSGISYVLADGTKIWQVGIRSEGAYSINVLFSEYHIPKGGKLFLYSADKSHVLGSFTDENNSEDNMLPTAPVDGDEIIVEYSEPADAEFEGQLKITEVNHDYRGILRAEPKDQITGQTCMPDILCAYPDFEPQNAVVLLTIDGTYFCTGTLLNNTSQDSTPYLLTAVHCLNRNFTVQNADYAKVAGSIVAFFNYNRPVCGTRMKGTEEMSVAGTALKTLIENLDIALVKLNNIPPDYYRPYYAGWNISSIGGSIPYINIHHPNGSLKKYGNSGNAISLVSYPNGTNTHFDSYSHWYVNGWNIGSTAGGSSGSALFDNNNLVIGGLTGGSSDCVNSNPDGEPDYFFALFKGWVYDANNTSLQLKPWLDPINSGATQCVGMNPYPSVSMERLTHANYNNGNDQLTNTKLNSGTGYLFGYNSLQTLEFAEKFTNDKKAKIAGIYLLNPEMTSSTINGININIYKSQNGLPGEKVSSVVFKPKYTNYASGNFVDVDKTTTGGVFDSFESFVRFANEPEVNGDFFVSYEISYPASNGFSTYNSTLSAEKPNYTWLKNNSGSWFSAENHPSQPMKTSLAVQPLVRYIVDNAIDVVSSESSVWYSQTSHTLYSKESGGLDGVVELYTITGQLVGKYNCTNTDSFSIPESVLKGQLGVIRILSPKNVQIIKVIF